MEIAEILKDRFPKVNRVFFEEEIGSLFLRVEVNLTKLTEVEEISKQLSEFLDQNYTSKEEYFLDVYSKGADLYFQFDKANQHLDQHVKVDLKTQINDNDFLVGKLKSATAKNLELWVNNKGQIKKHIIEKTQIKSLAIFIKD